MTARPGAGAVVYAKEMERVAAFYSVLLGLKTAGRDDEHVRLESPVFQLVVLRMPGRIAATVEISVPPVWREDAAVKLVFFVPSLSQARAAAVRLGGMLNGAATEWVFDGWRVCDGIDPEGNVIQLRERVG
jgi:predicted enzyme related to lactoylglutathione lyase